jgi:LexA-binding, inner membrane-associated putative hydrolase
MLVGTHALMPVCACLFVENRRVAAGRERLFSMAGLVCIALFGVVPDLCTPHLSLEARHASWSHTVWFMAGLLPVVGMLGALFEKGTRLRMASLMWVAAGLHLVADAVSGGIAWLYPWRLDVIGKAWISAEYWIAFDAFFMLLTWFFLRVLPHLEARNIRAGSVDCDPD